MALLAGRLRRVQRRERTVGCAGTPPTDAGWHTCFAMWQKAGSAIEPGCDARRGLGPPLHEGNKSVHICPQPLPDLRIEERSRCIEHLISAGHVEHGAKPGLHA